MSAFVSTVSFKDVLKSSDFSFGFFEDLLEKDVVPSLSSTLNPLAPEFFPELKVFAPESVPPPPMTVEQLAQNLVAEVLSAALNVVDAPLPRESEEKVERVYSRAAAKRLRRHAAIKAAKVESSKEEKAFDALMEKAKSSLKEEKAAPKKPQQPKKVLKKDYELSDLTIAAPHLLWEECQKAFEIGKTDRSIRMSYKKDFVELLKLRRQTYERIVEIKKLYIKHSCEKEGCKICATREVVADLQSRIDFLRSKSRAIIEKMAQFIMRHKIEKTVSQKRPQKYQPVWLNLKGYNRTLNFEDHKVWVREDLCRSQKKRCNKRASDYLKSTDDSIYDLNSFGVLNSLDDEDYENTIRSNIAMTPMFKTSKNFKIEEDWCKVAKRSIKPKEQRASYLRKIAKQEKRDMRQAAAYWRSLPKSERPQALAENKDRKEISRIVREEYSMIKELVVKFRDARNAHKWQKLNKTLLAKEPKITKTLSDRVSEAVEVISDARKILLQERFLKQEERKKKREEQRLLTYQEYLARKEKDKMKRDALYQEMKEARAAAAQKYFEDRQKRFEISLMKRERKIANVKKQSQMKKLSVVEKPEKISTPPLRQLLITPEEFEKRTGSQFKTTVTYSSELTLKRRITLERFAIKEKRFPKSEPRHQHKCIKCQRLYAHVHQGGEKEHDQSAYQCPYVDCEWYFRRGLNDEFYNKTRSYRLQDSLPHDWNVPAQSSNSIWNQCQKCINAGFWENCQCKESLTWHTPTRETLELPLDSRFVRCPNGIRMIPDFGILQARHCGFTTPANIRVTTSDIETTIKLAKITDLVYLGKADGLAFSIIKETKFRKDGFTQKARAIKCSDNLISGTPVFNRQGHLCSIITCSSGDLYHLYNEFMPNIYEQTREISFSQHPWYAHCCTDMFAVRPENDLLGDEKCLVVVTNFDRTYINIAISTKKNYPDGYMLHNRDGSFCGICFNQSGKTFVDHYDNILIDSKNYIVDAYDPAIISIQRVCCGYMITNGKFCEFIKAKHIFQSFPWDCVMSHNLAFHKPLKVDSRFELTINGYRMRKEFGVLECNHSFKRRRDTPDLVTNQNLAKVTATLHLGSSDGPIVITENDLTQFRYKNQRFVCQTFKWSTSTLTSGLPIFNSFGEICSIITFSTGGQYYGIWTLDTQWDCDIECDVGEPLENGKPLQLGKTYALFYEWERKDYKFSQDYYIVQALSKKYQAGTFFKNADNHIVGKVENIEGSSYYRNLNSNSIHVANRWHDEGYDLEELTPFPLLYVKSCVYGHRQRKNVRWHSPKLSILSIFFILIASIVAKHEKILSHDIWSKKAIDLIKDTVGDNFNKSTSSVLAHEIDNVPCEFESIGNNLSYQDLAAALEKTKANLEVYKHKYSKHFAASKEFSANFSYMHKKHDTCIEKYNNELKHINSEQTDLLILINQYVRKLDDEYELLENTKQQLIRENPDLMLVFHDEDQMQSDDQRYQLTKDDIHLLIKENNLKHYRYRVNSVLRTATFCDLKKQDDMYIMDGFTLTNKSNSFTTNGSVKKIKLAECICKFVNQYSVGITFIHCDGGDKCCDAKIRSCYIIGMSCKTEHEYHQINNKTQKRVYQISDFPFFRVGLFFGITSILAYKTNIFIALSVGALILLPSVNSLDCNINANVYEAKEPSAKETHYRIVGRFNVGDCIHFGTSTLMVQSIKALDYYTTETHLVDTYQIDSISSYGCPGGQSDAVCEEKLQCDHKRDTEFSHCTHAHNNAWEGTSCAFGGDVYINTKLCVDMFSNFELQRRKLVESTFVITFKEDMVGETKTIEVSDSHDNIDGKSDIHIDNIKINVDSSFDKILSSSNNQSFIVIDDTIFNDACTCDKSGKCIANELHCREYRLIQHENRVEIERPFNLWKRAIGTSKLLRTNDFSMVDNTMKLNVSSFTGEIVVNKRVSSNTQDLCVDVSNPKFTIESGEKGGYTISKVLVSIKPQPKCLAKIECTGCSIISTKKPSTNERSVFEVSFLCGLTNKAKCNIIGAKNNATFDLNSLARNPNLFINKISEKIVSHLDNSTALSIGSWIGNQLRDAYNTVSDLIGFSIYKVVYYVIMFIGIWIAGTFAVQGNYLMAVIIAVVSIVPVVVAEPVCAQWEADINGMQIPKELATQNISSIIHGLWNLEQRSPIPCNRGHALAFYNEYSKFDYYNFLNEYCKHGAKVGYQPEEYVNISNIVCDKEFNFVHQCRFDGRCNHVEQKTTSDIGQIGCKGDCYVNSARAVTALIALTISCLAITTEYHFFAIVISGYFFEEIFFFAILLTSQLKNVVTDGLNYIRSDYSKIEETTEIVINTIILITSFWIPLFSIMFVLRKIQRVFDLLHNTHAKVFATERDAKCIIVSTMSKVWPKVLPKEAPFVIEFHNNSYYKIKMSFLVEMTKHMSEEMNISIRDGNKHIFYISKMNNCIIAPDHAVEIDIENCYVQKDCVVWAINPLALSELKTVLEESVCIDIKNLPKNLKKGDSGKIFLAEGAFYMHSGVLSNNAPVCCTCGVAVEYHSDEKTIKMDELPKRVVGITKTKYGHLANINGVVTNFKDLKVDITNADKEKDQKKKIERLEHRYDVERKHVFSKELSAMMKLTKSVKPGTKLYTAIFLEYKDSADKLKDIRKKLQVITERECKQRGITFVPEDPKTLIHEAMDIDRMDNLLKTMRLSEASSKIDAMKNPDSLQKKHYKVVNGKVVCFLSDKAIEVTPPSKVKYQKKKSDTQVAHHSAADETEEEAVGEAFLITFASSDSSLFSYFCWREILDSPKNKECLASLDETYEGQLKNYLSMHGADAEIGRKHLIKFILDYGEMDDFLLALAEINPDLFSEAMGKYHEDEIHHFKIIEFVFSNFVRDGNVDKILTAAGSKSKKEDFIEPVNKVDTAQIEPDFSSPIGMEMDNKQWIDFLKFNATEYHEFSTCRPIELPREDEITTMPMQHINHWAKNNNKLIIFNIRGSVNGHCYYNDSKIKTCAHVAGKGKLVVPYWSNESGSDFKRKTKETKAFKIELLPSKIYPINEGDLTEYAIDQTVMTREVNPTPGEIYVVIDITRERWSTICYSGTKSTGNGILYNAFQLVDITKDPDNFLIPYQYNVKGMSGSPIINKNGHVVGTWGTSYIHESNNKQVELTISRSVNILGKSAGLIIDVIEILKKKDECSQKNQILRIKAPTGSGKTVNLPRKMLYHLMKKGNGKTVCVLIPTKVACIRAYHYVTTMVASEGRSHEVGVELRHGDLKEPEKSWKSINEPKNRIIFQTYGSALRSAEHVVRYDMVFMDEIHTRNDPTVLAFELIAVNEVHHNFIALTATPFQGQSAYYDLEIPGRNPFAIGQENLERWQTSFEESHFKIEGHEGKCYGIAKSILKKQTKTIIFFPTKKMCRDHKQRLLDAGFSAKVMHSTCMESINEGDVICATDILESSITIDGVSLVIDLKLTNKPDNIMTIENGVWSINYGYNIRTIDEQQSIQRMGRTGRTCEGSYYSPIDIICPKIEPFPKTACIDAGLELLTITYYSESYSEGTNGQYFDNSEVARWWKLLHPENMDTWKCYREHAEKLGVIDSLPNFRARMLGKASIAANYEMCPPIIFYALPCMPSQFMEHDVSLRRKPERQRAGFLASFLKHEQLENTLGWSDVMYDDYKRTINFKLIQEVSCLNANDLEFEKAFLDIITKSNVRPEKGDIEIYNSWYEIPTAAAIAAIVVGGYVTANLSSQAFGTRKCTSAIEIQQKNQFVPETFEFMKNWQYNDREYHIDQSTKISNAAKTMYNRFGRLIKKVVGILVKSTKDDRLKNWYEGWLLEKNSDYDWLAIINDAFEHFRNSVNSFDFGAIENIGMLSVFPMIGIFFQKSCEQYGEIFTTLASAVFSVYANDTLGLNMYAIATGGVLICNMIKNSIFLDPEQINYGSNLVLATVVAPAGMALIRKFVAGEFSQTINATTNITQNIKNAPIASTATSWLGTHSLFLGSGGADSGYALACTLINIYDNGFGEGIKEKMENIITAITRVYNITSLDLIGACTAITTFLVDICIKYLNNRILNQTDFSIDAIKNSNIAELRQRRSDDRIRDDSTTLMKIYRLVKIIVGSCMNPIGLVINVVNVTMTYIRHNQDGSVPLSNDAILRELERGCFTLPIFSAMSALLTVYNLMSQGFDWYNQMQTVQTSVGGVMNILGSASGLNQNCDVSWSKLVVDWISNIFENIKNYKIYVPVKAIVNIITFMVDIIKEAWTKIKNACSNVKEFIVNGFRSIILGFLPTFMIDWMNRKQCIKPDNKTWRIDENTSHRDIVKMVRRAGLGGLADHIEQIFSAKHISHPFHSWLRPNSVYITKLLRMVNNHGYYSNSTELAAFMSTLIIHNYPIVYYAKDQEALNVIRDILEIPYIEISKSTDKLLRIKKTSGDVMSNCREYEMGATATGTDLWIHVRIHGDWYLICCSGNIVSPIGGNQTGNVFFMSSRILDLKKLDEIPSAISLAIQNIKILPGCDYKKLAPSSTGFEQLQLQVVRCLARCIPSYEMLRVWPYLINSIIQPSIWDYLTNRTMDVHLSLVEILRSLNIHDQYIYKNLVHAYVNEEYFSEIIPNIRRLDSYTENDSLKQVPNMFALRTCKKELSIELFFLRILRDFNDQKVTLAVLNYILGKTIILKDVSGVYYCCEEYTICNRDYVLLKDNKIFENLNGCAGQGLPNVEVDVACERASIDIYVSDNIPENGWELDDSNGVIEFSEDRIGEITTCAEITNVVKIHASDLRKMTNCLPALFQGYFSYYYVNDDSRRNPKFINFSDMLRIQGDNICVIEIYEPQSLISCECHLKPEEWTDYTFQQILRAGTLSEHTGYAFFNVKLGVMHNVNRFYWLTLNSMKPFFFGYSSCVGGESEIENYILKATHKTAMNPELFLRMLEEHNQFHTKEVKLANNKQSCLEVDTNDPVGLDKKISNICFNQTVFFPDGSTTHIGHHQTTKVVPKFTVRTIVRKEQQITAAKAVMRAFDDAVGRSAYVRAENARWKRLKRGPLETSVHKFKHSNAQNQLPQRVEVGSIKPEHRSYPAEEKPRYEELFEKHCNITQGKVIAKRRYKDVTLKLKKLFKSQEEKDDDCSSVSSSDSDASVATLVETKADIHSDTSLILNNNESLLSMLTNKVVDKITGRDRIAFTSSNVRHTEKATMSENIPRKNNIAHAALTRNIAAAINKVEERGLETFNLASIVHFDQITCRTLKTRYLEKPYHDDYLRPPSKNLVPQGRVIEPLTETTQVETVIRRSRGEDQKLMNKLQCITGIQWEVMKRYNRMYLPKNTNLGTVSKGFCKATCVDRDTTLLSSATRVLDISAGAGGFAHYFSTLPIKTSRSYVFNTLTAAGHVNFNSDAILKAIENTWNSNTKIQKINFQNGDFRLKGVFEAAKKASPLGYDLLIIDCGESNQNLDKESKWMNSKITIRDFDKAKVISNNIFDSIETYTQLLQPGASMFIKMMGFRSTNLEIVKRLSKIFTKLTAYKMPTSSYQSREWYLICDGKRTTARKEPWTNLENWFELIYAQWCDSFHKYYSWAMNNKNKFHADLKKNGSEGFGLGLETKQKTEIDVQQEFGSQFAHVHLCSKCGKNYVHIHQFKRKDHWQQEFQCPNPECSWYWQLKYSVNATRSQFINLEKVHWRKEIKKRPYVPVIPCEWRTPNGEWITIGIEELKRKIDLQSVRQSTDQLPFPEVWEKFGEEFRPNMEGRWARLRSTIEANGYHILPPTGFYNNIFEIGRVSFKQKFGNEKHTANSVISDMMYDLFGLTPMTSVIGHTQCTVEHLMAAHKKRLDLKPIEPNDADSNTLLAAATANCTPEYWEIANGPENKKFEPWTFEYASSKINNQGAGGHFDKYQKFKDAIADPKFKDDVLQRIDDLKNGRPVASYQTCRDKRETKAKKSIDDEGNLIVPAHLDPNTDEYKRLNHVEKKVRRAERLRILKESANISPRNIRYAEFVQRMVDLMILGPYQHHHNNVAKMYMGSTTGTPLWNLGDLMRGIYECYCNFDDAEYRVGDEIIEKNRKEFSKDFLNAFDKRNIKFKLYSDAHSKNVLEHIRKAEKILIASGDFSGWDGTVNNTDHAIEFIHLKRIYQQKYWTLLKNRMCLYMFSITITDLGNILLGWGQRGSGDQQTSSGNTYHNDNLHVAAMSVATGLTAKEICQPFGEILYRVGFGDNAYWKKYYLRRVSNTADGDDNNHFGTSEDIMLLNKNGVEFIERCGKKLRCGSRPGYHISSLFSELDFCSHNFVRVRKSVNGKQVALMNIHEDRPKRYCDIVDPLDPLIVRTRKIVGSENWTLVHQRIYDALNNLTVQYMPKRNLPEIVGKLTYTIKQAVINLNFNRDYGWCKKEQKRSVMNEHGFEITRGKALAYLLNYAHIETVRVLVAGIMAVVGDGSCNLEQLRKRGINVPSSTASLKSAIKSVFNIDDLNEIEPLPREFDRNGLKVLRRNCKLQYEKLEVAFGETKKKFCATEVVQLSENVEKWARRFCDEKQIRYDHYWFDIINRGAFRQQTRVIRADVKIGSNTEAKEPIAIRVLKLFSIFSLLAPAKRTLDPSTDCLVVMDPKLTDIEKVARHIEVTNLKEKLVSKIKYKPTDGQVDCVKDGGRKIYFLFIEGKVNTRIGFLKRKIIEIKKIFNVSAIVDEAIMRSVSLKGLYIDVYKI